MLEHEGSEDHKQGQRRPRAGEVEGHYQRNGGPGLPQIAIPEYQGLRSPLPHPALPAKEQSSPASREADPDHHRPEIAEHQRSLRFCEHNGAAKPSHEPEQGQPRPRTGNPSPEEPEAVNLNDRTAPELVFSQPLQK